MGKRTDIQALRGLAVLLVVLYHARLPPIGGGYLGVDIFFVISGFLITSIVARTIRSGAFSFTSFYYRRARRLLPAAYLVLAACIALSPFLLTEEQMGDFMAQVFGTLTFTGNMVLWQQTGYFEGAAELKPLLHVWSLAIEEQYYLLLPAALAWVNQRWWFRAVCVLAALSLAIHWFVGPIKPGATFYLFPSRAWELGVGSTIALAGLKQRIPAPVLRLMALPAAAALVIVPLFPPAAGLSPALAPLLVCLATAIVIVASPPVLNNNPLAKALARVGDFSYSLYLVHWPIFAFLNNANLSGGGLWWPVRLGGLIGSFGGAFLLYRFVEERFRLTASSPVSPRFAGGLLFVSMALAASVFLVERSNRSGENYAHRLRGVEGLSMACGSIEGLSKPECRTDPEPDTLVWGDSFAMHLVPGLATTTGAKLLQATRSTCAPLLGLALYAPPKHGKESGRECIRFNEAVFEAVKNTPSLKTVVLAHNGSYILNGKHLVSEKGTAQVMPATMERAVSYSRETIRRLQEAGKRVVLMAPPPNQGFDIDIGRCLERKNEGKITLFAPAGCEISLAIYRQRHRISREYYERTTAGGLGGVYSLDDTLCRNEYCATQWGEVILYRDAAHLSWEGSIAIAEKVKLLHALGNKAK